MADVLRYKKITLIVEDTDGVSYKITIPRGKMELDITHEIEDPEIRDPDYPNYFLVLPSVAKNWKLDLHVDIEEDPEDKSGVLYTIEELKNPDEHKD